MELRLLRAFVSVADLGSISQAAVALGLTQSSLSRVVASLEKQCGARLFHRTGRGVSLTQQGREVLPRARRIVEEVDHLASGLRESEIAPGGTVTLAVLPSAIGTVAGELFDRVREANPRITLRFLEGFSSRVEEWLADGQADIGVMSRYLKSHARNEVVVGSSPVMLVGMRTRAKLPETVRFRDLATVPLVLPARTNGMRVALDRAARKLGFALQVVAEADSIVAQKAIVQRRGCYTILGPQTAAREIASGELQGRTIVEPRLNRWLVISTTTHHPLGAAARQVFGMLRRLESLR